ncbi:MAG TPA: DUF1343 domain-containing protein [Armatimonadota bacterium]|jgi:uncharacterized protein YbbC (DUF1343 family)
MAAMVQTGLDVLAASGFERLRGLRVALLCNQASIAGDYRHSMDLFADAQARGVLTVAAVFGPQHGLWGHTQDNMIEWDGFRDPRTSFLVHSLYGVYRQPTPEMLKGVEAFVVDLPDVGARLYTFLWTMTLCLDACAAAGIPVIVLDRPNPLSGARVEGPVLNPEFQSFIGRHPVPIRHGMTMAEMARMWNPSVEAVCMEGWRRGQYFDDTGLPWAPPSPNMPSLDTAIVYPGLCLIEGTNLSEGRGTTRPFETFGAPFVDGWALCEALNALRLPGAHFRPTVFEPTFDKHAGALCGGAFLHVTDRQAFEPVLTGIAVLQEVRRVAGGAFWWKPPPFEYEAEKMPIDILAGNSWVRRAVDEAWPLSSIRDRLRTEAAAFAPQREAALLYD